MLLLIGPFTCFAPKTVIVEEPVSCPNPYRTEWSADGTRRRIAGKGVVLTLDRGWPVFWESAEGSRTYVWERERTEPLDYDPVLFGPGWQGQPAYGLDILPPSAPYVGRVSVFSNAGPVPDLVCTYSGRLEGCEDSDGSEVGGTDGQHRDRWSRWVVATDTILPPDMNEWGWREDRWVEYDLWGRVVATGWTEGEDGPVAADEQRVYPVRDVDPAVRVGAP